MGVISRRQLVASGLACTFYAAVSSARGHPTYGDANVFADLFAADEQYFDAVLLPPPESLIDYPIEPVDVGAIRKKYRRQIVSHWGPGEAGTVVVDPGSRFLYYVLEGNRAVRYGVGVGRAGFAWSGEAVVRLKRRWPRWVPPREMVDRDENARKWVNGQPGGPDNPLGARALYLFQGNVDTLYRIHGTSQPETIGTAVSSGCIRMINPDVADLYERVPVGAKVIVLPASATVAEREPALANATAREPAPANVAEREPRPPRGFLYDLFGSRVSR